MRKRTLIPLLIAILLLCVLGVLLYLRAKAPPEAARLLPESDAIIFLNLKPVRSVTHFDKTPLERSPDFQHFIDVTGIVPERDLDSVAFAFHRMPDPNGPNGPVAFSEVFVGRFDGVRLAQYLHSIASSEEPYAGRTIFTIPVDGRQLRIAQLGYDILAASNMPTTEQIHSMLDRSRAGALSTPGSSLLAARYHEVPILSEAWGIGHIGLPLSSDDDPNFISVLGLQLPLRTDTDFVASLRYTAAAHVLSGGAVHLRVEEFAPDPNSATATVDTLTNLLNLLRGISAEQAAAQQSQSQQLPNPSNNAIQAILNSVTLTHHDSRVLLNANAGIDQLKALTTTHDPAASPLAPSAFHPATPAPALSPPARPSSTPKRLHATRTATATSN
ncbi:MAG TPA: hypothetical protein VK814_07295 [Acidobacteriaceae bacterium]|nr:hypothetical protein [Acidobacteriaceae bacterium]